MKNNWFLLAIGLYIIYKMTQNPSEVNIPPMSAGNPPWTALGY